MRLLTGNISMVMKFQWTCSAKELLTFHKYTLKMLRCDHWVAVSVFVLLSLHSKRFRGAFCRIEAFFAFWPSENPKNASASNGWKNLRKHLLRSAVCLTTSSWSVKFYNQ